MNCVLYARVSTDKQAEKDLSLPAQLQAMREHARQRGWTVCQEFIEPGASARTTDRPALQSLLTRCKHGEPRVDIVLVHKLDRLARNVYDHATIRALLKQQDARLASVVENTDDTIAGELVENIMASIAQFYSANLGEEARKGMRQKVLQGGWPHKAPRGYVSASHQNGQGTRLVLQDRESSQIRLAFELYATGHYSVKSLSRRLAAEGLTARSGKPIAVSYLRRLLANAFYTGRIKWGGLDVPGTHPPLVSPELFAKVQSIIAVRERNLGPKSLLQGFHLRGLAICAACRARMTAERHGRWNYYRCGRNAYRGDLCPRSLCNAAKAHKDLERVCQQVRLTRETCDAIIKAADSVITERVEEAARRKNQLENSLANALRNEVALTEAFTSGDMSPVLFHRKCQELRASRLAIESELARLPVDSTTLSASIATTVQAAASLRDLYEELRDERKAELLKQVFDVIVLSRDGIAGFTLRPPFDRLAGMQRGVAPNSGQDTSELVDAILDAA